MSFVSYAEFARVYSYSPLTFNDASDIPQLQAWLDGLKFKGRATPGMKKDVERLRHAQRLLERIKEFGIAKSDMFIDQIKAIFSWWSQEDVDRVNAKLQKKSGEVDELKLRFATYHNNGLSFRSFKTKAGQIDRHLSKFTGFHKKALKGNVVIRFVTKEMSRAKATYKGELDELYIRADAAAKGNTYASLLYIVTHELGHRYEALYRLPTNFDLPEWWTTRYSRKDSWAGSESFAELFALSFDPVNFQQRSGGDFTETIERFLGVMP